MPVTNHDFIVTIVETPCTERARQRTIIIMLKLHNKSQISSTMIKIEGSIKNMNVNFTPT